MSTSRGAFAKHVESRVAAAKQGSGSPPRAAPASTSSARVVAPTTADYHIAKANALPSVGSVFPDAAAVELDAYSRMSGDEGALYGNTGSAAAGRQPAGGSGRDSAEEGRAMKEAAIRRRRGVRRGRAPLSRSALVQDVGRQQQQQQRPARSSASRTPSPGRRGSASSPEDAPYRGHWQSSNPRGSASRHAPGPAVEPPPVDTDPWISPLSPLRWGVGEIPDGLSPQRLAELQASQVFNGPGPSASLAALPSYRARETGSTMIPVVDDGEMAVELYRSAPTDSDLWWASNAAPDTLAEDLPGADTAREIVSRLPRTAQDAVDERSRSRFKGPSSRAPDLLRVSASFPKGEAAPGVSLRSSEPPAWLKTQAKRRSVDWGNKFEDPRQAHAALLHRRSSSTGELIKRPWGAGPGVQRHTRHGSRKPLPKYVFGPPAPREEREHPLHAPHRSSLGNSPTSHGNGTNGRPGSTFVDVMRDEHGYIYDDAIEIDDGMGGVIHVGVHGANQQEVARPSSVQATARSGARSHASNNTGAVREPPTATRVDSTTWMQSAQGNGAAESEEALGVWDLHAPLTWAHANKRKALKVVQPRIRRSSLLEVADDESRPVKTLAPSARASRPEGSLDEIARKHAASVAVAAADSRLRPPRVAEAVAGTSVAATQHAGTDEGIRSHQPLPNISPVTTRASTASGTPEPKGTSTAAAARRAAAEEVRERSASAESASSNQYLADAEADDVIRPLKQLRPLPESDKQVPHRRRNSLRLATDHPLRAAGSHGPEGEKTGGKDAAEGKTDSVTSPNAAAQEGDDEVLTMSALQRRRAASSRQEDDAASPRRMRAASDLSHDGSARSLLGGSMRSIGGSAPVPPAVSAVKDTVQTAPPSKSHAPAAVRDTFRSVASMIRTQSAVMLRLRKVGIQLQLNRTSSSGSSLMGDSMMRRTLSSLSEMSEHTDVVTGDEAEAAAAALDTTDPELADRAEELRRQAEAELEAERKAKEEEERQRVEEAAAEKAAAEEMKRKQQEALRRRDAAAAAVLTSIRAAREADAREKRRQEEERREKEEKEAKRQAEEKAKAEAAAAEAAEKKKRAERRRAEREAAIKARRSMIPTVSSPDSRRSPVKSKLKITAMTRAAQASADARRASGILPSERSLFGKARRCQDAGNGEAADVSVAAEASPSRGGRVSPAADRVTPLPSKPSVRTMRRATTLGQSSKRLAKSTTAASSSAKHFGFTGRTDDTVRARTTRTARSTFVSEQEKQRQHKAEMRRRRKERAAAHARAIELEKVGKELALMNNEEWEAARSDWWPGVPHRGDVWRTVKVFVISTYADFKTEREILMQEVFPALNLRCKSRRLHVLPVDLHFGLHDDAEVATLESTLRELDKCQPFFIYLKGERYGRLRESYLVSSKYAWLKECDSGLSDVEIQVRQALLRKPYRPVYAFMYSRNLDFTDDIDEDDIRHQYEFEYDGAENAAAIHTRMDALHRELLQHGYLKRRQYTCQYAGTDDAGSPVLTGLEQFEMQVLDDLWISVRKEFSKSEPPGNPLDEERQEHMDFAEEYSQHVIGRKDELQDLANMAGLKTAEDSVPVVVRGVSGSGATALLAATCKQYVRKNPRTFTILHIVGATPSSTDVRAFMLRIARELCWRFLLDINTASLHGYQTVKEAFVKALQEGGRHALAESARILIVVDGVDMLHDDHGAHALDWLPSHTPPGVRIILSCHAGKQVEKSLRARTPKPELFTIPPLTKVDSVGIVEHYVTQAGWSIPVEDVDTIVEKQDGDKPYYLMVVCDELRRRTQRSDGHSKTLKQHIDEMPGDLTGLLEVTLERVEHDIAAWTSSSGRSMVRVLMPRNSPARKKQAAALQKMRDFAASLRGARKRRASLATADETHLELAHMLVRDTLCLLLCSRHGLWERELLQLMAPPNISQLPSNVWSRLHHSLEAHITTAGSVNGLLVIHHTQFARAIRGRYMRSGAGHDGIEKTAYRRLAEYFRGKCDIYGDQSWEGTDMRAFEDMVFYQCRALDLQGLRSTLTNLKFVESRANRGVKSLDAMLGELHRALFILRHARFSALKDELAMVGTSRKREEKQLEDFVAFVGGNLDALVHFPHLSFQLAYDQPDESVPHEIAESMAKQLVAALKANIQLHAMRGPASAPVLKSPGSSRALQRRNSQVSLIPDDGVERALRNTPRWWFERMNRPSATTLVSDFGAVLHAEPTCVHVSPDGAAIAVGLESSGIQFLNTETGETVLEIVSTGHTGPITCIEYSLDGLRLLSGSHDSLLMVWDTTTGEALSIVAGHLRAVTAACWLNVTVDTGAPLRVFASASMDLSIAVWKQRASTHDEDAEDAKASTQGVSMGVEQYDKVWTKDFLPSPIVSLDLCVSTQWLVAGRADGHVQVWDAMSAGFAMLEHSMFQAHEFTAITAVAIAPNHKYMATGALDSTVKFWELNHDYDGYWNYHEATGVGHVASVSSMVFSPDSQLLVSAGMDKLLVVWDVESKSRLSVLTGHTRQVLSVTFSQALGLIVSAGRDPAIKVWNTESVRVISKAQTSESHIRRAVVNTKRSTAHRRGLAQHSGYSQRRIEDTGPRAAFGYHADRVTAIAISRSNRIAATGSADREIKIWDAVTGEERFCLLGHRATISGLAFSNDGLLVSVDRGGILIAWDSSTFEHVTTLEISKSPLSSVTTFQVRGESASPQAKGGRRGSMLNDDGTLTIPGMASPSRKRHAAESPASGGCVAVVGEGNGNVSLWHVRSGERWHAQPSESHTAPVTSLLVVRRSYGASPPAVLTIDEGGATVPDAAELVDRNDAVGVGRISGLRGHRHQHHESNAHFHHALFSHAVEEVQRKGDHVVDVAPPVTEETRLISIGSNGRVIAWKVSTMTELTDIDGAMLDSFGSSMIEDTYSATAISPDAGRLALATKYKSFVKKQAALLMSPTERHDARRIESDPLAQYRRTEEEDGDSGAGFEATRVAAGMTTFSVQELAEMRLRPPLVVAPTARPDRYAPMSMAHPLHAPLAVDVRSWGRVHPPRFTDHLTHGRDEVLFSSEDPDEIARHEAAVKIQAMGRGYVARQKVAFQIEEDAEKVDSVVRMQALARGRSSRRLVTKERDSQRFKLSLKESTEDAEAENKIAKLQAVARGRKARAEANAKRSAAAKIGAVARGRRERQELSKKRQAATKLQALQRGRALRKRQSSERSLKVDVEDDNGSSGSQVSDEPVGPPPEGQYKGKRTEPPTCLSASFSWDGALLATGSSDHVISVASAARPQAGPVAQYLAHAEVTCVAAGPGLAPDTWKHMGGEAAKTDMRIIPGTNHVKETEIVVSGSGRGDIGLVVAGDATGRVYFLRLKDAARIAEAEVARDELRALIDEEMDVDYVSDEDSDGPYSDKTLPVPVALDFGGEWVAGQITLHRELHSGISEDVAVARRVLDMLGIVFSEKPYTRSVTGLRMRRGSKELKIAVNATEQDGDETVSIPPQVVIQTPTTPKVGLSRRRSLVRRAMQATSLAASLSGSLGGAAAAAAEAAEKEDPESAPPVEPHRRFTHPSSVMCIFGGASGLHHMLQPGLEALVVDGLIAAATELDSMIIDGGTDAGIMAMVGKALTAIGPRQIRTVGVAPGPLTTGPDDAQSQRSKDASVGETAKCPLEPHHSSFILTSKHQKTWGSETETMFAIIAAARAFFPTVAVLANGGPIAQSEVLRAVRMGIPLVVIGGSGRLADQLARCVAQSEEAEFDAKSIKDPVLREIVTTGRVMVFPVTGVPDDLVTMLKALIAEQQHLKQAEFALEAMGASLLGKD